MKVRFLGCGDAFGSGGRFNTCFFVTSQDKRFIIDCGASSLIAMKQAGVDRNSIDLILITHFHADHFGGVPFFMLDAQFFSKRTRPLTIAGPAGIQSWYERVMETSFPGSSTTKPAFELCLRELAPGKTAELHGLSIFSGQVQHGGTDGPFLAHRVTHAGKTIAYTGDTEWTDTLIEVGRGADLFIVEAYFRDKPIRFHLSVKDLQDHLAQIAPRRVILTHMSEDVLLSPAPLSYEAAYEGWRSSCEVDCDNAHRRKPPYYRGG